MSLTPLPTPKLGPLLFSVLQLAFGWKHVLPPQVRATRGTTVLLLSNKDGALGSQSAGGELCAISLVEMACLSHPL